jgi:AAHS family 4-hydroxybenzoate transporter-like MFS transporter
LVSGEIDVSAILNDARLGWRAIVIAVLGFFVIMLDGYDLLCMSFVAPVLARQLNIDVAGFGPIFTAAFAGIMVGGLTISPFGDRFGRKPILVLSVAAFGACSILPILDPTYSHLIIYRFVTGVGLGGAMPGAAALTAEYAPTRYKGLFVNLIFAGVSTGAILGGLLASRLIPLYGWQAAFWLATLAPLGLAVILLLLMPESVAFLAAANRRPAAIAAMLNRFDPSRRYAASDRFITGERGARIGRPVAGLFTHGRGVGTVLLWVMSTAGLFGNAILASWLPAIVVKAGLPLQLGILATVVMNVGGILGTILLGLLYSRAGATMLIAAALAITCAGCVITGAALTGGLLLPIIFVTGLGLYGGINSTNTLMAAFYPTPMRATGVGWALGIGRIGAATGPAIGGILLSSGHAGWTLLWVAAGFAATGLVGSLLLGAAYPAHRRPTARTVSAPIEPLAAH